MIKLRNAGSGAAALTALCVGLTAATTTNASTVPPYTLVGSYTAPSGAFDILPDGRLAFIGGAGNEVFIQDALNAGTYSLAGSIDAAGGIASFGASFFKVSPNGDTVAVGDNNFGANNSVYTFNLSSLGATPAPTQRFITPNFEAAWADATTLFVTGADSATFASGVTRVDTTGTNPVELVINDIGGASAGIAIRDGVLYTGNGFDTNPTGSDVGEVRAVTLADLNAGPVSFESQMIPVADALSANSLGFDRFGNLLIGGGDTIGGSDIGYAGVIDAGNISDALAGLGFTSGATLELDPVGTGTALYTLRFNTFTDELLVIGDGTVYRYAIPAPGTAILAGVAGLAASRRRRRDN